ncbi:MAG: chorismate mutase [Bacteroidales bacterium]|nr:chorismate mutase [Bacteroidales bacterium]
MRKPSDCKCIEDVREEIDRIDAEIIKLLGERFGFVKEVVKYKSKNKDSIVAKKRYDSVLETRRKWAQQNGLDPDLIFSVYKQLLDHFISEELKIIEKENNKK